MKIERISENQIKFILSQSDLVERKIKLDELAYDSEKTQELFHEMMEQALEEYDFRTDNTPLMIEAVPIALDSIMITITKVKTDVSDTSNHFGQNKIFKRFKHKSVSQNVDNGKNAGDVSIYSFDSLDEVANVSVRLENIYEGFNYLYKMDHAYYLVLENNELEHNTGIDILDIVIGEYGVKHVSTILSKYYLMEHGELLIDNSALSTLAKHLA